MENRLERSMAGLLDSGLMAGLMATQLKDSVKLLHSTGEFVTGLTNATAAANNSYYAARDLLSQNRAALMDLRDEGREFTMLSCDILKPVFGRSYSQDWTQAGFHGSLASPLKPWPLVTLVDALAKFFGNNPEREIPTLGVTAVAAKALSKRINDAIMAVKAQDQLTRALKEQRDKKFAALRKCMRSMVDELNILLEPLDLRWKAFGFNMPGEKLTPPAPEKVEVTVIENKTANITWPKPPRAESFRVWVKVHGVDAEPRAIASPSDPDFMMEDLAPQTTMEVQISAVNNGGESPRSAPVTFSTV